MTNVSRQLLNRQIMLDLIGDDQEMARQFELDFLRQAQESLNKVAAFYNSDKLNDVKEEAHFLKTSANAIGAEQTADLLQSLEQVILTNDKGATKQLIVKVTDSVKQVYGEIKNGMHERQFGQSTSKSFTDLQSYWRCARRCIHNCRTRRWV